MIWYVITFVLLFIINSIVGYKYAPLFLILFIVFSVAIYYIRRLISDIHQMHAEELLDNLLKVVDEDVDDMFETMYDALMEDYYDELYLTYDMLIADFDDEIINDLENKDNIYFRKNLRASVKKSMHDHIQRVRSHTGAIPQQRQDELNEQFKSEIIKAGTDAIDAEISRRLIRNHKLLVKKMKQEQ